MADVTVNGAVYAGSARSPRNIVFVTADIGYCFFIDSAFDLKYSKTTDGGATWGAAVNLFTGTVVALDVWFDQWTPGDSGTLIHFVYFDTGSDDVKWRTLDTSSDTLGTERVVFAGATVVEGRGNFCSVTKTRSGYLYVAYDLDAGAERGLHRSTDSGTTWSANLSTTFVEATLDECFLYPASNTGDDNDCWAIYHDDSANALTLKMWDSSAGNATESATIQTHLAHVSDATTGPYGYIASVRHSDGHLILCAVSERDAGTADHQVWDINGTGSITALTAITTDIDDHYYPAVFIDQTTDDIYVAFNGLRDGSQSLGVTSAVYYTKSTDGGTTWSAGSTAYMEAAATAVLQVWTPLMGPRFYVVWRNTALGDILGNKVNSLTFGGTVHQGAISVSGAASFAAAGVRKAAGALSVTGAGTFAADGTVQGPPVVHQGALAVTGAATFAAAGLRKTAGAWSVAGAATFLAAGLRTAHGAITLQGAATFAAAGELAGVGIVHQGSITMSGAATMQLAGTVVTPAPAQPAETGDRMRVHRPRPPARVPAPVQIPALVGGELAMELPRPTVQLAGEVLPVPRGQLQGTLPRPVVEAVAVVLGDGEDTLLELVTLAAAAGDLWRAD